MSFFWAKLPVSVKLESVLLDKLFHNILAYIRFNDGERCHGSHNIPQEPSSVPAYQPES